MKSLSRNIQAVGAFSLLAARAFADPATTVVNLPAPPPPAVVKLSAAQTAAFGNYLDKARQAAGLPGLAVAIVQPGQTLLLAGFGQRSVASDAPVTPDTRFALGPATAAFNSLLLARLEAQKILELDAPARRCWEDFKLADADATRTVTLRNFLGLAAGVPDNADALLHPPPATPADLFAVLAQLPTTAQPDQIFHYSDTSAAAAGYLAVYAANHRRAPAAGLPAGYAALVKTELFDPLGLKRATFAPLPAQPALSDDDATGHTRAAQGPWQASPVATASGNALLPALGLRASVRDVAAWLQLEVSGGLAPDGTRLLEEKAVQERWRPATTRDNRDYGLGWAQQHYRGLELISRMGEYENQAELLVIIPQYQTALVVLINGGGHDTALLLQDALLNFADFLREASTDTKN